MARSENQKLKLLYIKQFLEEKTDENHCVSANDIIDMLGSYGITAERKSIYSDIEMLKNYGMDIIKTRGKSGGIKLLSREFELTELKILVDAVQSSKFITVKKSEKLISKLEKFVSVYDRKELRRSVFIANRIKNENESIYYNTDNIFNAINSNLQITFKYFSIGPDRKKKYHNSGNPITVSPYGLQFDNEKYYLIAYDAVSDLIKHYRVDKMDNVSITNSPRTGQKLFQNFDIAEYTKKTVTMFTGTVENVVLQCPGDIAGQIIDTFGNSCKFFPTTNDEYTVAVNVALSPTFYSWIFTFGGQIKIISPQKAIEEYKQQLQDAVDAMTSHK